jgi:hypothetical protein
MQRTSWLQTARRRPRWRVRGAQRWHPGLPWRRGRCTPGAACSAPPGSASPVEPTHQRTAPAAQTSCRPSPTPPVLVHQAGWRALAWQRERLRLTAAGCVAARLAARLSGAASAWRPVSLRPWLPLHWASWAFPLALLALRSRQGRATQPPRAGLLTQRLMRQLTQRPAWRLEGVVLQAQLQEYEAWQAVGRAMLRPVARAGGDASMRGRPWRRADRMRPQAAAAAAAGEQTTPRKPGMRTHMFQFPSTMTQCLRTST